MWKDLPSDQRDEYKKMILAFASLSDVFAQKNDSSDSDTELVPIINSKYQETIFQKVFNASAEDIGNTSYDAAIRSNFNGRIMKYLVGIKTFGIGSDAQKVAQFKANLPDWSNLINEIRKNGTDYEGKPLPKSEIDERNGDLYLELATFIADLRNERIESSKANLQGFKIEADEKNVESVYHILMPSKKGDKPSISVGEISYSEIDVGNIEILGCTSNTTPQNFNFTDGIHKYRFTAADCQLYMYFDNKNIVQDTWNVTYVEDAYSIFVKIAEENIGKDTISESYSWKIVNKDGEVERYSGWNAFYGLGTKLATNMRETAVNNAILDYEDKVPGRTLEILRKQMIDFLLFSPSNNDERKEKEQLREKIMETAEFTGNNDLRDKVISLVYRPVNEMYIPVPNSKTFHTEHPDFFGPQIGTFQPNAPQKLALDKEQRQFNLIFEPSGDKIRAFITEDNGKAIESVDKQTDLGQWILRGIFQLGDYEPLTAKRLKEMEINGLRLYKITGSDDIHLQFIWIDDKKLPDDYIGR